MPVLDVNVGTLKGGVVGATEQNTKQALNQIIQARPCIVRFDEADRMFAGAGGGARDSGASDAQMGMIQTFLAERPSGIYCVATANSVENLMAASSGAFFRSGRWDALFFVDVPSAEQRKLIWPIYLKKYKLKDQPLPDDTDWMGADIESACRNAKLMEHTGKSLVDVAKQVIPISVTAKEQINALREWAHHRCLSADYEGLYDKNGHMKFVTEIDNKVRRKVTMTAKA